MVRFICEWTVWAVWFALWHTLFRLSPPVRMWLLVASAWAPALYLVVIVFRIGRAFDEMSAFHGRLGCTRPACAHHLGGWRNRSCFVADSPAAGGKGCFHRWGNVHHPVGGYSHRADIGGDNIQCSTQEWFSYCFDFDEIPLHALALAVIMLVMSLPAWTVAGIAWTVRFIHRQLHGNSTNGDLSA